MLGRPPTLALFPYTTLFRSHFKFVKANTSRTPKMTIPAPSALYGDSEEHTSELQSPVHLVFRLLLEKKNSNHPAIRAAPFFGPRLLPPLSLAFRLHRRQVPS